MQVPGRRPTRLWLLQGWQNFLHGVLVRFATVSLQTSYLSVVCRARLQSQTLCQSSMHRCSFSVEHPESNGPSRLVTLASSLPQEQGQAKRLEHLLSGQRLQDLGRQVGRRRSGVVHAAGRPQEPAGVPAPGRGRSDGDPEQLEDGQDRAHGERQSPAAGRRLLQPERPPPGKDSCFAVALPLFSACGHNGWPGLRGCKAAAVNQACRDLGLLHAK